MNQQRLSDYVIIVKVTEQWVERYQQMSDGRFLTVVGNKGLDEKGQLWRFYNDIYHQLDGLSSFGFDYGFTRA